MNSPDFMGLKRDLLHSLHPLTSGVRVLVVHLLNE